jgi:predicted ribosome quality control (RQC) complex YloA/Tae2 family protein
LEPITEDTVKFIMNRGVYRTLLEQKIRRKERMTLKDQINNKIENLRRKLKRHIEKAHREGDYEKETQLRRELEATYKRR